MTQLIASGKAEHAYLGVSLDASAVNARLAGTRSGTPARQAGLKAGDVVTALDGVDRDGQPLISFSAKNTTLSRVHLPTLSSAPTGLQPATPISPAVPPEAPPPPQLKGKRRGTAK